MSSKKSDLDQIADFVDSVSVDTRDDGELEMWVSMNSPKVSLSVTGQDLRSLCSKMLRLLKTACPTFPERPVNLNEVDDEG